MELKVPPPELIRLNPDQWTAPFWAAAAQHRLVCARCRACGTFRMPPSPFCPRCRQQEIDWAELSGLGTIYTYTIVTHAVLPSLQDHLPYAVGAVTLPDADGARLLGNVVGIDSDELAVDMPVRVQWADIAPDLSVPRLTPR
jgi:uncharacterized OB-fold protein